MHMENNFRHKYLENEYPFYVFLHKNPRNSVLKEYNVKGLNNVKLKLFINKYWNDISLHKGFIYIGSGVNFD